MPRTIQSITHFLPWMDTSAQAIQTALADGKDPRSVKAKQAGGGERGGGGVIPPGHLAVIRDLNRLEIELYDHAKVGG